MRRKAASTEEFHQGIAILRQDLSSGESAADGRYDGLLHHLKVLSGIVTSMQSESERRHEELLTAVNDGHALVLKLDKRLRKTEGLLKKMNEKPLGEATVQIKPDYKAAAEGLSEIITKIKEHQAAKQQAPPQTILTGTTVEGQVAE